ncbi:MAG TPA: hypothetical protein VMS17_01020, partial [Gemmataceae bacterium]|nr:hypothetical protein [Gemmataceae bacterium]
MSRTAVLLGVALGLAVALGILAFHRGPVPEAPAGPLLSECDGALRRVVIQYSDAADDYLIPTYRDFLRQLPAGVDVRVVCPSTAVYESLKQRVGSTACSMTPVLVDHPITSWSRDRWLELGPKQGGPRTLLCSRAEDGAAVWPDRAGDQRIADDLAAALGPSMRVLHSDYYFDGGDFDADGETAFARPNILLRNVQRTVATKEDLIKAMETLFQRRVVVLEGAPDHHVGMYLMPVGNRTVLIGDPGLAQKELAKSADEAAAVAAFLPGGPDFTAPTSARFEAVAKICEAAGYRVVRIPIVPG